MGDLDFLNPQPGITIGRDKARRTVEWLTLNVLCLIIVTHEEQLKIQYGAEEELSERTTCWDIHQSAPRK